MWEQAERRLEARLRQADALDSKAAALVGFHAVVVGFLVTIGAKFMGVNRWIGAAVIMGLLASGGLALLAFRTESYDRRPAPEELWAFAGWDDRAIRYRFISTRFEAIAVNRERLRRKARWLGRSLGLISVIALVVAVVGILELMT